MDQLKRWGVVFDCDGTLISRDHVSLVYTFDNKLDVWARIKIQELRDRFLTRALNNDLTPEEEAEWLEGTLKIYSRLDINEGDIQRRLRLPLRRGVKHCLQLLQRKNVPVAIVSYGVEQFIRLVLQRNAVDHLVTEVYAAKLIPDQNGSFVGYDPNSLVLPSNKNVWARRFAEQYGIDDDHLLAVGDTAGDAQLGMLKENCLGVAETPEQTKNLAPAMGSVVKISNFGPATKWLLQKIEGSS